MKTISIKNTYLIKVSDCDYEMLSQYTWHINKTNFGMLYARTWDNSVNPKKAIYMHRLILNVPVNMQGDHINGDTLNNTRENLRLVSRQQNCFNRKFSDRDCKGVSLTKNGKWHVQITDPQTKKKIHLGYHIDKIEALKEYDAIAKKLYGKYARLNFKDVA